MITTSEAFLPTRSRKHSAAILVVSLLQFAVVAAALVGFSPVAREELLPPSVPADSPPPGRSEADYDAIIREYAKLYGVEPALVKAVIRAESGFDPAAVSPRGARGLMQLMPDTARNHGVQDAHDPRQNIEGGVRYLRGLLDRFQNDLRLTVAAYNAGITAVKRYRGLPPYRETRTYVARVLQFRQAYRREERLGRTSGEA